jgi:predicted amidohydrolase YtcJ
VESPDVLSGIQCAVTRQDLDGGEAYLPGEAFTLREAIDSFTAAGAYASFEEHLKGSIVPGQYADFVVLGADPFRTAPDSLRKIPVLQTWLAGERVW